MLKRVLLSLLCLMAYTNSCWAIISGLSFSQNDDGTTKVSLVTNEPINFQITPESDEIIVVGGFRFSDWKAPVEGQGQGTVVDYFVEEYEDGSGELVLHTRPGARVRNSRFNMNGMIPQFDVTIEGYEGSANLVGQPVVAVTGVQVGKKGPYTRVVFDMNAPINFDIKYNKEGDKIAFTPERRVKWMAPTTDRKRVDVFGGYYLVDLGNKIGVVFVTRPGTKVANAAVLNAQSGAPKYVIDLASAAMVNAGENLFDTGMTPPQNPLNQPWGEPTPGSDQFDVKKNDQLIQAMNIFTQNDDTIINFTTKEPLEIDVTENEYTNQVIVQLPKTEWAQVASEDKKGGLIESYKIDQTDPESTTLTFNVQKGTSVIGSKVSSGGSDQASRFIIHLNQNENKSPDWLIDDATDSLPYDAAHREEAKASQLVYRGGVSEHATIGDGFYAGLQASYFGTEQKNRSSNSRPDTRNLRSGMTGVSGHLLLGLGKKVNRFYTGGELFFGYMGAKQVHEYQADGTKASSEVVPGFTWGAAARIGQYISPVALLYARVGILSTDFYFRAPDSARGDVIFPDKYAKRNRTGFLYALGLETVIDDKTTLRFETGQVNYQVFGHRTNVGGNNNSIEHRLLMNQLSLGVITHLNPMMGPSAITLYEDSVVPGLYIGGLFSFHNTYERRDLNGITDTSGGSGTKLYTAAANTDPVWGMYGGYSTIKDRVAYAGELQVSLTDAVISESIDRAGSGKEAYKDRLQWTTGLVGKMGWVLNHGVTAWGKLGVVMSRYKRSDYTTGTGRYFAASKRYAKNIFGVRTGADLEVAVNRIMGIRGSWSFDYYQDINLKDATNGNVKEKVSVMDNRFGLGLTIYLNDTLANAGLFR